MCLVLDEQQTRELRRLILEKKLADEVDDIVNRLVDTLIDRDALRQAVAEIETLDRETLWKELAPSSGPATSLPAEFAATRPRPAASEPLTADDDSLTVVVDGKRVPIVIGADA